MKQEGRSAMLYSMRNLTKRYGDRVVLDLTELFIEGGIIYGLLSPNGSGKSTLLSILSFLDAMGEQTDCNRKQRIITIKRISRRL